MKAVNEARQERDSAIAEFSMKIEETETRNAIALRRARDLEVLASHPTAMILELMSAMC